NIAGLRDAAVEIERPAGIQALNGIEQVVDRGKIFLAAHDALHFTPLAIQTHDEEHGGVQIEIVEHRLVRLQDTLNRGDTQRGGSLQFAVPKPGYRHEIEHVAAAAFDVIKR